MTGTGTATTLFYHVAFLVDDLQAGVDYWTGAAGVVFHPPVTSRLRLQHCGATDVTDVRLAFSRTGPPWIELIERCEHELFATPTEGGLHHVGFVASVADGPGHGAVPEPAGTYVLSPAGGTLAWFSPRGPGGMRIELVAPSYYAEFEAWLTRLGAG